MQRRANYRANFFSRSRGQAYLGVFLNAPVIKNLIKNNKRTYFTIKLFVMDSIFDIIQTIVRQFLILNAEEQYYPAKMLVGNAVHGLNHIHNCLKHVATPNESNLAAGSQQSLPFISPISSILKDFSTTLGTLCPTLLYGHTIYQSQII